MQDFHLVVSNETVDTSISSNGFSRKKLDRNLCFL